jgi:hypothetical protein
MTGRVLDAWTLTKPANWQADYYVRSFFEQYFISNYTAGDFLENTGKHFSLPCPTSAQLGIAIAAGNSSNGSRSHAYQSLDHHFQASG